MTLLASTQNTLAMKGVAYCPQGIMTAARSSWLQSFSRLRTFFYFFPVHSSSSSRPSPPLLLFARMGFLNCIFSTTLYPLPLRFREVSGDARFARCPVSVMPVSFAVGKMMLSMAGFFLATTLFSAARCLRLWRLVDHIPCNSLKNGGVHITFPQR